MPEQIALISDIHGDSVALEAVLADIASCGCERIYLLGDIVNGLDPAGCLAHLSTISGLAAIAGNAEWYVRTPSLADFPLRDEPRYADVIQLTLW